MKVARFICLLLAIALLIWIMFKYPMTATGIVYFLGWLFFIGLACVVLYSLTLKFLRYLGSLTKQ